MYLDESITLGTFGLLYSNVTLQLSLKIMDLFCSSLFYLLSYFFFFFKDLLFNKNILLRRKDILLYREKISCSLVSRKVDALIFAKIIISYIFDFPAKNTAVCSYSV